MKIIGIGWHKTGTTSLGHCMREFKFNHLSWDESDFELWSRGEYGQLLARVEQYDSFDDFPWSFLYKEIDQMFPGSKFILTRRKDSETWFNSICKHAARTGPLDYRASVYGQTMPHGHEELFISTYTKHNDAVRDYFKDRPGDLLEVCWEEGDGWAELASYLHLEAPNRDFPHVNRSPLEQEV